MSKKQIIGIIIFIILIFVIMIVKNVTPVGNVIENTIDSTKLTTVYVATGGGKEGFTKDKDIKEILKNKYGLNVEYDSWSNGKLIKEELVREDGTKYDAMFCSDQRFYDYYKLPADPSKGEVTRKRVSEGGLILNTPIVVYSWAEITDALVNEGIVTQRDGTYYITDMNKLLEYTLEGKKWSEIGVDLKNKSIIIESTDPVSSSPGATYYGLLLSIMCNGELYDEVVEQNLPKLKDFYIKSGYMMNTPADLFQSYLQFGMGAYPMIVDYEKSLIEFANSNPDGFAQIKDKIRVLYPEPTIWNSHCIASFNENGDKFYDVFEDKEIGQYAWERYGFRTGVTGSSYDVSSIGINGIPQEITSVVTSLKMKTYDRLIEYLGQ